jgi:hypothetical protein
MVLQYRVNWSGNIGGAGVSVLHARAGGVASDQEAADDFAAAVGDLFANLASNFLPTGVSLNFASEVVELNTTSGVLEDVYAVTPHAPIAGAISGNYARPAGVRVEWHTGAIVAGRRLQGRTFLVPAAAAIFQADGTLNDTSRAAMRTSAQAYVDEGLTENFAPAVWSRTHGILADVVTAAIDDEVAVLRSRRD